MTYRLLAVLLPVFLATLGPVELSPLTRSLPLMSNQLVGSPHAGASQKGVDPIANMDVCEIADHYGYQCHVYKHQVVTDDGFLLTLHRINGKKDVTDSGCERRPPVLLWHGLLGASISWVLNPPNETLAFLLSDSCYDVWLANSRGCTYSRAHKTLRPHQSEFWAWSWDEMAQYDVPSTVDFVLNATGYESLHYVGHSQGTLIAFAYLSMVHTPKISHVIALAPVFNVGHIKSPIKIFAPFANEIDLLFKLVGKYEFLPNSKIHDWLAARVCKKDNPMHIVCDNLLFIVAGFDWNQLNVSRVPVYDSHSPDGTSVQNIFHYGQMFNKKACTRFDYGSPKSNMDHYGKTTPPSYNISAVQTPFSLFHAENDWLADPEDVEYILENLRTIKNKEYIPQWDHYDFIYAVDAKTVMIDQLIRIIDHDFH